MFELRVLTQDWTNPDFDRRCKYGSAAVKTLPAGTKLVVRPYDFGTTRIDAVGVKYDTTNLHAAQLIALSTPCAPACWDDFRMLSGDTRDGRWSNEQVLALLWQDPATRAAVEAAYVKVNTD